MIKFFKNLQLATKALAFLQRIDKFRDEDDKFNPIVCTSFDIDEGTGLPIPNGSYYIIISKQHNHDIIQNNETWETWETWETKELIMDETNSMNNWCESCGEWLPDFDDIYKTY